MLSSSPHLAPDCHFPALGNTTKNKELQSKLQVWLPPFALRTTDKSSFHCVKGTQSAEQCKLAGPFSFQREAQSKLFWFTLEINQYGAGRAMKDPLRKERSSTYRGGSLPLIPPPHTPNCVKSSGRVGWRSQNGLLKVFSCLMVRKRFQNVLTLGEEDPFVWSLAEPHWLPWRQNEHQGPL